MCACVAVSTFIKQGGKENGREEGKENGAVKRTLYGWQGSPPIMSALSACCKWERAGTTMANHARTTAVPQRTA